MEEEELSWPTFSSESRECLLLQPEPAVAADPYPERMLLWQRLVWDPAISAVETERLKAERLVVNSGPPLGWGAAPVGVNYYVPLWYNYPWRGAYPTVPIFGAAG